MNFEHLCKYVLSKRHLLSPNYYQKIKKVLSYQYSIILLNRQKLKLGKIIFVIKEIDPYQPFQEVISTKFANQDVTNSSAERLESLYNEFS